MAWWHWSGSSASATQTSAKDTSSRHRTACGLLLSCFPRSASGTSFPAALRGVSSPSHGSSSAWDTQPCSSVLLPTTSSSSSLSPTIHASKSPVSRAWDHSQSSRQSASPSPSSSAPSHPPISPSFLPTPSPVSSEPCFLVPSQWPWTVPRSSSTTPTSTPTSRDNSCRSAMSLARRALH